MPAATSAMFFMPQIGLRPDEGEQCTIQHDQNFSNIVVLENRLVVCPICSGCFIEPRKYDENGNKNVNYVSEWIGMNEKCPNKWSSAGEHKITVDELHTVRIKEWERNTLTPKELYDVGLKYISDRQGKILNVAYLRGIMQQAAEYEPAAVFARLLPEGVDVDYPFPEKKWEASNNAGFMYFLATRTAVGFKSLALLFQAREMGCAEAAWKIWVEMGLENGLNLQYLEKAAAQGHPYSCAILANQWYSQEPAELQWKDGSIVETQTMLQYFKIAAKAGIRQCYEKCSTENFMVQTKPDGDTIPSLPNSSELTECFIEGAKQGDIEAQCTLAIWLIDGQLKHTEESGIYWLQTAAECGHEDAQVKLAYHILNSDPIDWETAIQWLSTPVASTTKNFQNLYHSCWAYIFINHLKDIQKANEHWELMAVKPYEMMGDAQVDQALQLHYYALSNTPSATYKAGLILEAQERLPEAFILWQKAAEEGHTQAKDHLLYYQGKACFDHEDMRGAVAYFTQMQNPPSEMMGDAYLFMSNAVQTRKRTRSSDMEQNPDLANAKMWYKKANTESAMQKLLPLRSDSEIIAAYKRDPSLHSQVRRMLIH